MTIELLVGSHGPNNPASKGLYIFFDRKMKILTIRLLKRFWFSGRVL